MLQTTILWTIKTHTLKHKVKYWLISSLQYPSKISCLHWRTWFWYIGWRFLVFCFFGYFGQSSLGFVIFLFPSGKDHWRARRSKSSGTWKYFNDSLVDCRGFNSWFRHDGRLGSSLSHGTSQNILLIPSRVSFGILKNLGIKVLVRINMSWILSTLFFEESKSIWNCLTKILWAIANCNICNIELTLNSLELLI